MFYGKHKEPKQIDYIREKEWMDVHLGHEHAWGEFHVIHSWKRS